MNCFGDVLLESVDFPVYEFDGFFLEASILKKLPKAVWITQNDDVNIFDTIFRLRKKTEFIFFFSDYLEKTE